MNRRLFKIAMLGVCCCLGLLGAFLLGRYPVSPMEVMGIAFGRLFAVEPFWTERMEIIFWNVRLPRIALSMLVGMSLSAAGASYQGVFQNPMASPDILGASSGAGFGAALAIMMGLSGFGIAGLAFLSGMICVLVVMLCASKARGQSAMGLLLSGIMIGSLFSAATSFLKLIADPNDQLPAITYWLMGSLSGSKLSEVQMVIVPLGIGLIGLLLLSWKLNYLTLGDDEARALGTNPMALRMGIVILSTLLTAASVAVSGAIGWVGLVVPHMMRKWVGGEYRYLMPASMLGGGLFLLIVDTVSRTIWTSEVPLGILTAFVGVPFFLYLILGREDDA